MDIAQLTINHNFKNKRERKRIEIEHLMSFNSDGYVHPTKEEHLNLCGSHSLPAPHLSCTRLLGHIYPSILHQPEIITRTLNPNDLFLFVVSDGVTDRVEARDAMNLVADCDDVKQAARSLVNHAIDLSFGDLQDNTTAVVVYL
jgi:serine/threonine protein phosphatase PrpC